MSDSAAAMWAAFLASGSPDAVAAAAASYTAWHFGSGGEMADELAELVLSGRKTATASALWAYELEGEPLPQVGDFSLITDGAGKARCVIRNVSVDVTPFSAVDEAYAAAEGEGDLSLEYWRDGHWKFFSLDLATFGREPQLDMPVVCVRFAVVYPTVSA